MSKDQKHKHIRKRTASNLKRRNKKYNKPSDLSNFGIMLKKARYQAINGVNLKLNNINSDQDENLFDGKYITDIKKHLATIYSYFGYLVFAKKLIDDKVIPNTYISIDMSKKAEEIISINKRLKTITLIDEETAYMLELFEIGELIQNLATDLNIEISKLESSHNVIENLILRCSESLDPKADGTPYTKTEAYNEVIKIFTQDFFVSALKPLNEPSTNVDEKVLEPNEG